VRSIVDASHVLGARSSMHLMCWNYRVPWAVPINLWHVSNTKNNEELSNGVHICNDRH